jgi:hypothetical protein
MDELQCQYESKNFLSRNLHRRLLHNFSEALDLPSRFASRGYKFVFSITLLGSPMKMPVNWLENRSEIGGRPLATCADDRDVPHLDPQEVLHVVEPAGAEELPQ